MEEDKLMMPKEYQEAGVQIGARIRTPGMSKFITTRWKENLYLLDLELTDSRIRTAAKMLATYEKSMVVATASRIYAIAPAKKFGEITGISVLTGRVMPGIFTNPNRGDFIEPEMVLVSDTRNERQAVREASKINAPVIALCDTDNWIKFVDLVVPCNNKGRRSLALIYYLLAREYMKETGMIKSNAEFNYSISDFEAKIEMKTKG
ncbi:MAG: 30S ribosomal protein S2 [Candidatus Micrarchaeales archaeon]